MNAIRIRIKLDSDTLHLPELKPLIGKTIEIIVQEAQVLSAIPGAGDWEAAFNAVEELEDYDFDALRRHHECDLEHARDHLPKKMVSVHFLT